ncbi:hypothetical protein [Myroides odoratus]|uniref:hypothetical protein n=1 Tax=Myroides odoratus TaxID=256 RepID=UPI0039B05049
MEHLYDYIGENYPYLFPMSNVVMNELTLEYTTTISSQNQFTEFSKIVQIAASLGSISLLSAMKLSSKTFFLGEKLRMRKIPNTIVEGELKFCTKTLSFSKRKGKVLLDIFDNQAQLVYTAELEYVIFDEASFHQVFSSYYTEKIPVESHSIDKEIELNLVKPSYFNVHIPEVTSEQCKGHFDNYPIVPGVLIVKRLLEAIEKIFKLQGEELQNKTLVIDSFEIFLNAAIPIHRELNSLVHYRQIAKDSYLFICPINDHKTEYANYVITVTLY